MHLLPRSPGANENLPKNLGSPRQLWFQSVIKIGSFLKSAKVASSLLRLHTKNMAIYSQGYNTVQSQAKLLSRSFSAYQKYSSKTWATTHDIIGKKKEYSTIPKVVINQRNQI